ncbi:MAG: hypothetical protein ACJATA_001840, partial [Sphingobacteriales bacterium]
GRGLGANSNLARIGFRFLIGFYPFSIDEKNVKVGLVF